MYHRCNFLSHRGTCILTLLMLTFTCISAFAQDVAPQGESAVAVATSFPFTAECSRKQINIFAEHYSQASGQKYSTKELTWSPPAGREIDAFNFKKGNSAVLFILLDDGSVYETTTNSFLGWSTPTLRSKADPTQSASGFRKLVGDALYCLSNTVVFVSRDTANSWSVDTSGLGTGNPNDITTDTLQYVYLAHNNGLFRQHPDSSVWHKLSTFPSTLALTVFADRKNRIFASSYSGVYESADGGSTWNTRITGLNGAYATGFGDDAFSNVYAIAGIGVFRSDSGTGAWVRIDTSISSHILDPVNSFSSPFTSIAGDTLLFLGTKYGVFYSADQGHSWSVDSGALDAKTMYGFVKTGTKKFVSTGLGVFSEIPGSVAWSKSFPAGGYLTGGPLFLDNAGTIYTLGPVLNTATPLSIPSTWKSTDNGATWIPDTAGLGAISQGQIPKYFVDETGVQHYAFSGTPAECYVKASAGLWAPDTAGFSVLPQNYPNIIASDKNGFLYAAVTSTISYTGLLLKRPLSGGTWIYDTAGLNGSLVYSITPGKSGTLFAGTYGNGLYKRTGSTWSSVPLPSGLGGSSVFVTAEDSSGALFAGFSNLAGFNFAWHGIYYTTNNGITWTYAGLDSIPVLQLSVYGDTVYAATYYDGLYELTKSGVTKVDGPSGSTPSTYALFQNFPNPFNPTTKIGFQLSALSKVSLKIYDLLGREVETLVDGEISAGVHRVTFDASRFASGIYFYRLQAGNFTATKKLLLLK